MSQDQKAVSPKPKKRKLSRVELLDLANYLHSRYEAHKNIIKKEQRMS